MPFYKSDDNTLITMNALHLTISLLILKVYYCKLTFDVYRNFALFILSYSCARLYNNTPAITKDVPSADKPVTGLLNNKTESHIRNALFAVLATLQQKLHYSLMPCLAIK